MRAAMPISRCPSRRRGSSHRSPRLRRARYPARGVERSIDAFVRSAKLARDAGYDGVEVMGSEGYLINQFLTPRTNKRT